MSEIFNPWSLPRPPIREDERDYTDPRHPGISVRLRFRELNPFSEGQAIELYGKYVDKFIKPQATGNGKEPTQQLLPTPEPILLNETTLDNLVTLLAQQVAISPDIPKYSITEWCGFAVNMPTAFREMVKVCRELNAPLKEKEEGNELAPEAGSGEQLSIQQSEQDPLTQTGCSTSPDALVASLKRSELSLDTSTLRMGTMGPIPENLTSASSETTPP